MKLAVFALSLATLCAPGIALAQDSTTGPTDPTPPPSADCTTADCNTLRNEQDNLNNNSGTPGASDSLEDSGSSGSGTLKPTTPDSSLGGDDDGLSGGNDNGGGLSGSGSLGGSSSGGSGL